MSREEEIPPERALLDCLTRIDNLIEIQIKTTRRTNELLEMLLGIRRAPPEVVVVRPPAAPPAAPPVVPPAPPPTAPPTPLAAPPAPPPAPPELSWLRSMLFTIQQMIKTAIDHLSWIGGRLFRMEMRTSPVTDYLSEEKSAPKSPARLDYNLKKELQRSALNGYIANDGPGELQVKINRRKTIRLANGEVLDFNTYFKRPLEIKNVEITTPTSATFRILLW